MKRNTKYTCKFSQIYSASEIRNTKQIKNLKFKIINGFTLIELLVVMAIIMLLMAVGLASYQNAQKSGRDGKRKTDLRQVQSALEMYRADNDQYPPSLNGAISVLNSFLVPKYISGLPSDPTSTLIYHYDDIDVVSPGVKYKLCAYLENTTDRNTNCSTKSCGILNGTAVNCNYGIFNP